MIKIEKIQLNNFRFFIDEEENNTFKPNAKGLLVYGENGSGKSSLFKAFELLATATISAEEFAKNINIFSNDNTYLEFDFSNDEPSLRIDSDELSLNNHEPFVKTLSVSKPMIEYKQLLKVSYSENNNQNLYPFFEKILENYPIDNEADDINILKDLDGEIFFNKFKEIILWDILEDINYYLNAFNQNIKITDVVFDGFNKTTFLDINFFDENITTYHHFLNEARLSALAISVYFAIIKKQFDKLGENSLKILVLDDLLISLDMNNRLSLIDILKTEFSDFQIFFFSHEKALYDLINEKMSLKAYEVYVNKKDNYEVPFIKQSNTLLDQAIYQKDTQNYGCSANILRQYTEKLLCQFLPKEQILDRRCKVSNLDTLLTKAKKFEETKTTNRNQDIVDILIKLKTFKRVLLNDASHYNSTEIYKNELENVIDTLISFADTISDEEN